MSNSPTLAIIGRANAGKSSLFNRLTRAAKTSASSAIVAREPGTTRDNVLGSLICDSRGKIFSADDFRELMWRRHPERSEGSFSRNMANFSRNKNSHRREREGAIQSHPKESGLEISRNFSAQNRKNPTTFFRFRLIDTAGLKTPDDDFESSIQDQITDAIDVASAIVLVVDRTEFPSDELKKIAKTALKSRKPVLLLLNKSDLRESLPREEFLKLGIRDIFEISAEHNTGISTFAKKLINLFPDSRIRPEQTSQIRFAKNPESSEISCDANLSGSRDSKSVVQPEFSDSRSESKIPRETLSSEQKGEKEQEISRLKNREENLRETNPEDFANNFSNFREIRPIKVALIGRPNTGKSSLFNSLAKKQQAIVSSKAGTTRDVNRVQIKYKNRDIEFLDTAGIRKSGRIATGIEKFSVARTMAAIDESDICLLLMDANELNTSLDQKLAGIIAEQGKGLILVVSKWDLREKDAFTRDELAPEIAKSFDFAGFASLIFTSAKTGQNVAKLFDLILQIDVERHREIPTRELNNLLREIVAKHPPAGLKNTHPKFRYIVQTDVSPPWFVIFGANFKFIHWSYKRYLENSFRAKFGFAGTPIKFSFRDEKQIRANHEN